MEGLNGRIKQWRGTDQKCSRGFGGIGFFVPACSWLWPLPMAIRWRKKWPLPESEKVRKKPWATATDSCSSSCYPSWDRRSSFLSNQRKELIETVWSFFKRYRIQADFFFKLIAQMIIHDTWANIFLGHWICYNICWSNSAGRVIWQPTIE